MRSKLLILLAVAGLLFILFQSGLLDYLTLSSLKTHQAAIDAQYLVSPIQVTLLFMGVYILCTALSLPGATILTLAGGAIFSSVFGTLVVLVSATIGASLAFLASRFIFRKPLEKKYAGYLQKFDAGLRDNAFNYLLFLRLVPLFPFFLINIVLGLSRLPLSVFVLASFLGMLPGTFVYTHAGSQLSTINSLADVASPGVLGAFALLGCFALLPIWYQKMRAKKETTV